MGDKKGSEKKQKNRQKKSIADWFFSRQKMDQDYVPDLKTQWAQMDNSDRIKFVLGAVVGLLLFIGALALAYYVLSLLINLIF